MTQQNTEQNIGTLVNDLITPLSTEQLIKLAEKPTKALSSLDELWERACYIFGPGMFSVRLGQPEYQEWSPIGGEVFFLCNVRAILQVCSENNKRCSPQEVCSQVEIRERTALAWLTGATQAEEEAIFKAFSCYGPQFRKFRKNLVPQTTLQTSQVEEEQAETPRMLSMVDYQKVLDPIMTDKQLKIEQQKYWADLCKTMKVDERAVFLGLIDMSQDCLEWTMEQMELLNSLIDTWCNPKTLSTDENLICRANWMRERTTDQKKVLDGILLELKKENNGDDTIGKRYVTTFRDTLGFKSFQDMNRGQMSHWLRLIQNDRKQKKQQSA